MKQAGQKKHAGEMKGDEESKRELESGTARKRESAKATAAPRPGVWLISQCSPHLDSANFSGVSVTWSQ